MKNSPSAKSIRLPGLMCLSPACPTVTRAAASTSAPARGCGRTACWICVRSAACPNGRCWLCPPTAFRGKHYRYNGVERYGGQTIHIRTSAPLYGSIPDGEGSLPLGRYYGQLFKAAAPFLLLNVATQASGILFEKPAYRDRFSTCISIG